MSTEGKRNWVEVGAAILLAVSAVATAWSSYQATRWNGEQAKTSSRVNKTRIDASRAADRANALTQVDIATFIQWVDAYAQDEAELESFYRTRFRDEFKPAFDAWIATRPLESSGAAPTPFALPEYKLASAEEAARLDAQAEVLAATVRRDIQRASNYVLAVVLFAVALFFAGMSTKLGTAGLRTAHGGDRVARVPRRGDLDRDLAGERRRLGPWIVCSSLQESASSKAVLSSPPASSPSSSVRVVEICWPIAVNDALIAETASLRFPIDAPSAVSLTFSTSAFRESESSSADCSACCPASRSGLSRPSTSSTSCWVASPTSSTAASTRLPRRLLGHGFGRGGDRGRPVTQGRAEIVGPLARARRAVVAAAPGQQGGGEQRQGDGFAH